jgi:hypothetical protein
MWPHTGDWLSWLEHYLDMVGVTGSSPVSPIFDCRTLANDLESPQKHQFPAGFLFPVRSVAPLRWSLGPPVGPPQTV